MPTLNVTGSDDRLLGYKTNTPAECLHYCWLAIGQGAHYITGGAANAYATWLGIPVGKRQVGDRNVPKGMPAFLGIRTGTTNILGDVIISRGDGTFVATDYPTSGHIGVCTLDQRIKQTGRVYLGWAPSMGGYDLISTTTAGSSETEIGDDDMPSADEVAAAVWGYQLGNKQGGPGAVFGRAADWMTNMSDAVASLGIAGTDPAKIAAAITPVLVPALVAALGKNLTEAQVEDAIKTVFASIGK